MINPEKALSIINRNLIQKGPSARICFLKGIILRGLFNDNQATTPGSDNTTKK